jgi:hypothetical protein
MNLNGWWLDPSIGVWLNEGLSIDVLHRAEIKANLPRTVVEPTMPRANAKEYALAISAAITATRLPALVERLATLLPKIRVWRLAPHLRRGSKTQYECSCGAILNTEDFGRAVGAHLLQFPTHAGESVTYPGNLVAFYGIGQPISDGAGTSYELKEGGAL